MTYRTREEAEARAKYLNETRYKKSRTKVAPMLYGGRWILVGVANQRKDCQMSKIHPRIGDVNWNVSWIASVPTDEYGDFDWESADQREEMFDDYEVASNRATEVQPLDFHGCVLVTKCEFVAYDDADATLYPNVGFWDHASESEVFAGNGD